MGDDRQHLLGNLLGEREESGPDPARCDQRSVSVHSIRSSCFPGRPRVQFAHFPMLSERAPRQRGPYVNVMFSTWVQPRMGAALGAHSNTRGIWPDPASRGFEGRHAEEDARRGIFPPASGPEILSEVKVVDRVLITGGNGFIGSHLAECLEERGHSVTLFDVQFNGNTTSLQGPKIRGDIRDYGAVKAAVAGHDAVFHFAAVSRVAWGQMDPYACWTTNQLGTLNVLEACRKSETRPVLFYASSREVYGEPQYLPVDENHPKKPLSVYGMTKLCAERACGSYADPSASPSVHPVIFRFSNVYGSERDLPERVIPKFIGDPGKSHKVLGHEPRVRLEEGLKILRERMLRF